MPFAVMQKTPTPPSIDALKRALVGVPGFTAFDAYTLNKDCRGIIAKGLEQNAATAMCNGLMREGIESAVVDESALPALPDVQFLAKLEFKPDALVMYDQLGRTADLAWKDIAIVAAGHVMMSEFKETAVGGAGSSLAADLTAGALPMFTGRAVLGGFTGGVGFGGTGGISRTMHEDRRDHGVLEIIPTGAVVRYCIDAEKQKALLYQYLGERRTPDARANFALVIQDILRNAPGAAINQGAYYLRENASNKFSYPTKQCFYSEIIWLLWMMGAQPAS